MTPFVGRGGGHRRRWRPRGLPRPGRRTNSNTGRSGAGSWRMLASPARHRAAVHGGKPVGMTATASVVRPKRVAGPTRRRPGGGEVRWGRPVQPAASHPGEGHWPTRGRFPPGRLPVRRQAAGALGSSRSPRPDPVLERHQLPRPRRPGGAGGGGGTATAASTPGPGGGGRGGPRPAHGRPQPPPSNRPRGLGEVGPSVPRHPGVEVRSDAVGRPVGDVVVLVRLAHRRGPTSGWVSPPQTTGPAATGWPRRVDPGPGSWQGERSRPITPSGVTCRHRPGDTLDPG